MKTLSVTSTDPYFNLALEEYLLKEKDLEDDLFFVWRNDPCVVIGRNQNPFNEVNLLYAQKHHIPVLRRISGGGTVYHDLGNINFTFLTGSLKERLNNYRYFLQPLIDILNKAGIPARFVESSHIYVNGHKISGNAQSFHKDRMMHHGTLLFDGDLSHLNNLLRPERKYKGHSVDSTRSSTTNLKEHFHVATDVESFMNFLLDEMRLNDDSQQLQLTPEDIRAVEQLAKEKYRSRSWTYGETAAFWIHDTWEGEVLQLKIERGRISESSFEPDLLEGLWFDPNILRTALMDRHDVHELLQKLFQ